MNASIRPSGGAVTQFPMMPEKITLGADAKFMTYSIISLGDVKIPRGQGIKEISWSGIFPGKARKNYPFVSSWVDPNTLIKRMEQYRDNGTICKLLVTGTCINYSVYISSFKGKYSGGLGDFYYDIKFIIAREIKIYTTKELKNGTSSKTQRPASKKSNKKSTTGSKTTTYTIKSGDTLSRIAQKKLGKASRYPEIYKLNKSKIEAAAKKHGRKSSNNGHWIYPGTNYSKEVGGGFLINVNNVSYTVIVITEKKLQLNITQAVEELGWEENEDELAMKIHFNMYNALYNKERLSSLVKINSVVVVKAYWGSGKGIVAMGNIVECERKVSKSDDVFNVVAYDNLFNLQKSSDNVYFASGKKTKSILTAIFKSWGITISKYTGPNVAHKKILLKNKKLGDIIREVLDEAKKKGGGAAIVRSTESKVQVIAKGSNTDIYHFSGDVSSQVSHKISIANLVTRVKIVSSGKSDEAAKVEATVNGKTQYGVFQTIITHSKSDKLDDAKKEAKEILEEKGSPKVTSKLIAPDIPCVRKGDIIHAKVGSLNGYYLINSIQHNAKNGQMTMDVKKTADPTAAPKKKTPGTTKKKTYKVGDVVNFKGGTHYDSSWSDARGYRATAGKAKITLGPNCAGNGKAHPWHLVHMDSKSNVYGWVDEGTFE